MRHRPYRRPRDPAWSDPVLAPALSGLRAAHRSVRPDPGLRARVLAALRPAPRRRAKDLLRYAWVGAALLGFVGGCLTARGPGEGPRAGAPEVARASQGPHDPGGRVPCPARGIASGEEAAVGRLQRLISTAGSLPAPAPEVLALWRECLQDPDDDVRTLAQALLDAAEAGAAAPEAAAESR